MKEYSYLVVVLASVALAGCASALEHSVKSTDPSQIFVGEEAPEGYPETYIAKNGTSCESVTESWVKDEEPVSGKTMWRKVAERETVTCE